MPSPSFSFRLSDQALADELAAEPNISAALIEALQLRQVVRRNGGTTNPAPDFKEIARQLHGVSTNLNQIARVLERMDAPEAHQTAAELREAAATVSREVTPEVDSAVRQWTRRR